MIKELLLTISKALVDNPDAVSVEEVMEDDTLVLMLTVAQEDKGKVIGKQGKIASAVRSVVKAAASQSGKKAVVKIV